MVEISVDFIFTLAYSSISDWKLTFFQNHFPAISWTCN